MEVDCILLILGWALGMAIGKVWKVVCDHISDASLRAEKRDEEKKDFEVHTEKMKAEYEHVKLLCREAEADAEKMRQKYSSLEYENLRTLS